MTFYGKTLIVTLLLASLCSVRSEAQIAKWVIKPAYDEMELLDCGLFKVKLDGKCGLINQTGKEILPIRYDSIAPFSEDKALIFKGGQLSDIVDIDGNLVSLADKDFKTVDGACYFADGYLLVKNRNNFYYLDSKGERAYGPYAVARPFRNGYAPVSGYENITKNTTDLYHTLLSAKDGEISIPKVNQGDINFVSGVERGEAIICVKKKFYRLDPETLTMTPVTLAGTGKKPQQVESEEKVVSPMVDGPGRLLVQAKVGRFLFDDLLRLREIDLPGDMPETHKYSEAEPRQWKSDFAAVESGGLYGLNYKTQPLLPPQFQAVKHFRDNTAVVRVDGKDGLLGVDPDGSIQLSLNNNEPVGFMHQYHNTSVTAILPPSLQTNGVTISSRTPGCEVQRQTRSEQSYIECNMLSYGCRLSIPKGLTNNLGEFEYRFALKYDGLQTVDYALKLPHWFVKAYEVVVPTPTLNAAARDSLNVEFEVMKSELAMNDNANYFKNVEITSPHVPGKINLSKLAENRYSFNLGVPSGDRAAFIVKITEAGCPTMEYPFELSIVKPTKGRGPSTVQVQSGTAMLTPNMADADGSAQQMMVPQQQQMMMPQQQQQMMMPQQQQQTMMPQQQQQTMMPQQQQTMMPQQPVQADTVGKTSSLSNPLILLQQ